MKTCQTFFLVQDSLVATALGELLQRDGCKPVEPSTAPAEALPVLGFAGTPQEHRKDFFSDLAKGHCFERLKNGAVAYWPCRRAPWEAYNTLSSRDQEAFRCVVLLAETGEEVISALKSPRKIPPWAIERVRSVLLAKDLYGLLEHFGHGGAYDLTNQMLGPARLLLGAGERIEDQSGCWNHFLDKVIDQVEESVSSAAIDSRLNGGNLGRELLHHAQKLPRSASEWEAAHVSAIDGLLALLTSSRSLAGIKISDSRKVREDKVEPIGADDASCRMLVVDDHARSWRPVLELVHSKLQERLGANIRIDFSTNGTTLTSGLPLLGAVAEYDAVLLDIFLGEVYGLKLLQDIRAAFLHVPVIMWTTARELDLPADANLANGFIFKKTTSVEALANLLERWLDHGRASRAATIPNRFFDHSIRKIEQREAIKVLNGWALQLLDGFPALNESYFCNFTDHGGRHFVQILEYMEQIVRPLVLTSRVFSNNPERRAEELAVLYLALLCHEFGMFPIFDKEEHSFAGLSMEENNGIRALHSVRGMEYLERKFLFDFGGSAPGVLQPKTFMHTALCLIVGYHSRLLPISSFGSSETVEGEIERRGKATAENRSLYTPSARSVAETLSRLAATQCFVERREQIRALCSLVRFVDAIDVDQSRLPPAFLRARLAHKPNKEPKAYAANQREYLKRQLLVAVSVDRGSVSFKLMVPAPDCDTLASIQALGVPTGSLTSEQILSPWDPAYRSSIKAAKDGFEKFLTSFFLEIASHPHYSESQLSAAFVSSPATTIHSATYERGRTQRSVAIIAALTVAGEIIEEYKAIEECDLNGIIKLGEFKWGDNNWNPDETELKVVPA